ncbi:hypothetical protein L1987_02268 [Smallanthus sonchifolius]|uniref:Uncharacterized protein n=1 Tax=Smallanthus sonchifolius TaxID=185202 RepID=A0ACB9K7C3_9ASTR|nr:hypothetical protein L1987_02268 [Smallanthus sonchifolius]
MTCTSCSKRCTFHNKYPGGPLLNPFGLPKDIANAHEWKLKEIKNGRLAMVAMLGIFVQANVTKSSIITASLDVFSQTRELTRPNPLNGAGSLREGNPVENMDAHYILTYKGCYLKNEMRLEQWRKSKQHCGT